jgi:hypothetical protein
MAMRFVGRLDFAAHQVLDHLVALIHTELDEIAPAGRADEVEAGHARLVNFAEDRTRVFARPAEGDADRFEELARCVRTELEENQLRRDARDVPADGEVGVAGVDLLHAGAEVDRQLSSGLPAQHVLGQHLVGARDLRSPHDQADAILVGQCDGYLERRIAGADDEQILIAMFGGID